MAKNKEFKRVNATFFDDEAIEVEILEKALRIDKLTTTKTERDTALVRLAIHGLRFAIDTYSKASSVKYPSADQMKIFFDNLTGNK